MLQLIRFHIADLFEADRRDTETQRLMLFVLAIPICRRKEKEIQNG